jgi:4-hydroxyphenylpyruvate dioxygenase
MPLSKLPRGAEPYQQPQTIKDEHGEVRTSGINFMAKLCTCLLSVKTTTGRSCRGIKAMQTTYQPPVAGLLYVDHCVGNVGWHKMNQWVNFYEDIMGFRNILTFDDKMISTEYSALMSKVMSNGNGYVKFPINEPAEGKKKSQIEEYLEFYEGEGVQHLRIGHRRYC